MDNTEEYNLLEELDKVCYGIFYYDILCNSAGYIVNVWNGGTNIIETGDYLNDVMSNAINMAKNIIAGKNLEKIKPGAWR